MKPLIATILLWAAPLVLIAGDHPLADRPALGDDVQRAAPPSHYAGLDEPADDVDAERMRRRNLEILSEKLGRRSQLNAEIAELERTLDMENQYSVRCRIVEMPYEVLEAVSQDSLGEMNSEVYRRILDLEQESKIKILADQSLLVVAGRAATSTSGGEVSIPASQGQGSTPQDVSKQSFGVRLEALLEELGDGRLKLQCAAEIGELRRDVEIGGVPLVERKRASSTVRLMEGETVNFGGSRITTAGSQMREIPAGSLASSRLRKWMSRKTSLPGDASGQSDQITLFLVTVDRQKNDDDSDVAAH